MALSSVSSSSLSPLSPTIIHYQQKYQSSKASHYNHLKVERHDRFRKLSHTNSSFRHQNQKQNRILEQRRHSSNVWETHRSSNGRIYYYNIITDHSQWEKPLRDQLLSSSISKRSPNKYHIHSKRISNHHNTKKSIQLHSISDDDDDVDLTHRRSNNSNKTTDHHKKHRRKPREDKTTPTSPPPNEIVQIDLVDPISTPTISISSIHSQSQSCELFHQDSCLHPSASTINAILELEHSHSNSNDIIRYYRGELIEHLLNWPSTQIEREAIRLSNEQTRIRMYQLISLRTDLYFLRLRYERNRFQLFKYHHKS